MDLDRARSLDVMTASTTLATGATYREDRRNVPTPKPQNDVRNGKDLGAATGDINYPAYMMLTLMGMVRPERSARRTRIVDRVIPP